MKEITLERRVDQWVRKRGGFTLKLTSSKGVPDRLVCMPGGVCAFIEFKKSVEAARSGLSKLQGHWARKVRGMWAELLPSVRF